MGLAGFIRLALAAVGIVGASTITITLGLGRPPYPGLDAVGRSLAINSLYVLAALAWSLLAFQVLDRFGGLRGIDTRDQLEQGNLAVAGVVAATLLGVFFISAWTMR
jgi:hypothetical protein